MTSCSGEFLLFHDRPVNAGFHPIEVPHMDQVTLIGLLAGTLTTIAFIPQLQQTWRTRSANDVSLGMLLTFIIGVFSLVDLWPHARRTPDHSGESYYLGADAGHSHFKDAVPLLTPADQLSRWGRRHLRDPNFSLTRSIMLS